MQHELNLSLLKDNVSSFRRVVGAIIVMIVSSISNPMRQFVKHVGGTPVGGPFDCIDDHVEKAYCDDAKVKNNVIKLLIATTLE